MRWEREAAAELKVALGGRGGGEPELCEQRCHLSNFKAKGSGLCGVLTV